MGSDFYNINDPMFRSIQRQFLKEHNFTANCLEKSNINIKDRRYVFFRFVHSTHRHLKKSITH